jgi:hypothetical protein
MVLEDSKAGVLRRYEQDPKRSREMMTFTQHSNTSSSSLIIIMNGIRYAPVHYSDE